MVRRYLQIPSAWGPTWSADGARVAFLSNAGGLAQVWERAAVPRARPRRLTRHSERVMWARRPPAGEALLFAMDAGGNERAGLRLLSRDGERDLTRRPDAIHTPAVFSPDGGRIAYTATRRNGVDFDVYVQDLDGGEPELVWQLEGAHAVADWDPGGRFLVVSRARSSADGDVLVLDLETRRGRLLTPHQGEVRFVSPRVSADGTALFVATDRDGEFLRLGRLDLATGGLDHLTADDWDVEELAVARDGSLAATRNVEGYSELVRFDADGGALPGVELPPGIVRELAFAPDSRHLALTFSGPRHTTDVWLVELAERRTRRLTRSAPGRDFRAPALVRYPSFDGRRIPALLYEPADRAGAVVVNVHGGPESQARPGFDPVTQLLLARGYAVLAPNVRGSTGYGKAYTHLDDVRRRMDSVEDLACAGRWLREHGHERIVVHGGSYGGFMVLATLTEHPDLWSAGVDIVGIANLVSFLENTGAYRRALREAEYGSLARDRDFLRSISPIHKADRIRAPLIVLHGRNDPRVPVGEAEQIVAAVRARGGVVEYVVYDDEGHGFARLANRVDAYERIVAFLDAHAAT